jgi:hypothetical protein
MLESAYTTRSPGVDAEVYLGFDFYAATVPLPDGVQPFQTTPGSYQIGQHKPPGYRTVRRWSDHVNAAKAKRVCGEWRFCDDDYDNAEVVLPVRVPQDCVLSADA